MASSPLPFPFPPTTTSYRAGAIFKFEKCQSALHHPVHHTSVIRISGSSSTNDPAKFNKKPLKKIYDNSGFSYTLSFLFTYIRVLPFLMFHLRCVFIANFKTLNVFWSCTIQSGVSWHHCCGVCLHLAVLLQRWCRFHCFVLDSGII